MNPEIESKNWYESKTIWFNLVVSLLGLAAYILEGIQNGQIQSPLLIDINTAAFWYGIINMALRYVTTKPLTQRVEQG